MGRKRRSLDGVGFAAKLDELLGSLDPNSTVSIDGLLESLNFPDQGRSAGERSLPMAERWSMEAGTLYEMLPGDMIDEMEQFFSHLKYSVEKIYQHRELHGKFDDDDGQEFPITVRLNSDDPEGWCGKCDLEMPQLCVHLGGFISHIDDELQQTKSTLSKQISRHQWAKGKPVRPKVVIDNIRYVKRELHAITDVFSRQWKAPYEDAALPPLEQTQEQRLAWALRFDGRLIDVDCVLQQRKKRGSGFTKGRKISVQKLATDRSLPLSDADQRVLEKIEASNSYYYSQSQYLLHPLSAIFALAGHNAVTLNDVPCSIQAAKITLKVIVANDDQCRFVIRNPWRVDQVLPTLIDREHIAILDQENSRLSVDCVGETLAPVVKSLVQVPSFSPEHLPEVSKQIQPLRSAISIELPESIGGPLIDEVAPLAMLLRSRTDGKLDYAVRMMDAESKLRIPGANPLIVSDKREGKLVQLMRRPEDEQQRAATLLKSFKLSDYDSSFFGTIDDFETGLRLLERLQSDDLDVEVMWDKSSEKPVKVLSQLSSKNVRVDISSKRNWFGITGECKFGDQTMPLGELLSSLQGGQESVGNYIRLGDGAWTRIGERLRERLKRLRDATHSDRKMLKLDATAAPAIRDLVDDEVEIKATKAWEKCYKRLAKAEKLQPTLPENLDATLRDYQVDGYKWMRRLAEWGVGGILADDMGLGKTLQTLAVLLDRAADGPALVIAPTSVGFNWQREAERFAPDLEVHLYRETQRAEFLGDVGPGTLVVCSYGLALRDAEALAKTSWNTLVLDEAQAIKNSRSKTSKAIASIEADWTVALTGTPVENHLGELWSLFHVVSPGVFGGWDSFRNRYANPIEKQNDDDAREALAERLKPFVLRRTKSEVLKELPPRTEMNLYVDLSPAERAEYEQIRMAAIGEVEQIESLPNIQDQRFKILALMTRLRQIACHAGLVNEDWQGTSAKLDQLCETLEELREEGHRSLVFSQFTSHLALIRKTLEERGFTYEYLDGSTPAKARQEAVDRFQSGAANAFLISLKAGGTGLNLTAADYVIHMDPWWNPAVEDQATDRAHRIGQDKPVMVYRIVARGTIEEEILALHDSKRDLVAGVMKGTQAAAKLTNEDLIRMLRG